MDNAIPEPRRDSISNLIFKWTIRLLFRLNSFQSRSIEDREYTGDRAVVRLLDRIENIRGYRHKFPVYNINYLSTTLNILRKHTNYIPVFEKYIS